MAADFDQEVEDQDFDGEDEQEGEVEETLDDLDDEIKARVDKVLAKQRQEFDAQLNQRNAALEEWGMGFTADGKAAIRDTQKVAAWSGAREQPAPQPAAKVVEEEDDEIDLYSLDGKGLRALIAKEAAKIAAEQARPLQETITRQGTFIQGMEARGALDRVESAVSQMAPHLAEVLQHPDFAANFQEFAMGYTPEQLRDPKVLVMGVGAISGFLDPSKQPQRRARNAAGQFTMEGARGAVNRMGLQQVAAPRDAGRQANNQEIEARRRLVSEHVGREIAPEVLNALSDEKCSIEDWRRAKAAAAGKRR